MGFCKYLGSTNFSMENFCYLSWFLVTCDRSRTVFEYFLVRVKAMALIWALRWGYISILSSFKGYINYGRLLVFSFLDCF